MINPNFVILGALFNLAGSISYLKSTIVGKSHPNRVTWLLWACAPMIAFIGEIGQDVGIRSLMTFMSGFGPLLVFLASFVNKKAYWKISKLDWACGFLSICGLVLYLLTRHGAFAITLAIASDALAAVPTLIKAYKYPETENYRAFLGGFLSAFIALLTISDWRYANWGFPIYVFVICLVFIALIRFKLGKRLTLVGNS